MMKGRIAVLGLMAWLLVAAVAAEPMDTMRHQMDSLMRELQELKMLEVLMRQALDESGRTAREDSLRKERRRQHIDSLRTVTRGVPVVVGRDTLFCIYASLGGEDALHRAEAVARRVERIGKSLKWTTDSMHIFESDYTTDIMCGEMVIMGVSDLDGLWEGTDRNNLARRHLASIDEEIEQLHADYGLKAKLAGIGWAVFLVVVQILLFMLTVRFVRYLRRRIIDGRGGKFRPLMFKSYELLSVHDVKRILLLATRLLQVVLILLQLFISLPLLFSIFPETEQFTWNMISYVWAPLRDLFLSLVRVFPNLVKIAVVVYLVRWLLKGLRHVAEEISSGRLRFDRFYGDWAYPTYHILRIFIIAFTLVVIWPWLPGSDSGIFKGVSIFVAALFSLGSSSTIGNLISGIIITYMRPFLVGDFVRIGDYEGEVIEKNTFITRLKDIKGNVVTVPNNSILLQQTVNYTAALRHGEGSIVHSEFTFTYKVPRQTIEAYLLEGAARCPLLMKEPAPFVLVTSLDDFYTRYEINGYTQATDRLFMVYSELHKHIVDVFREHDLDPTSSHFVKVQSL